jgi:hypothetical protein
MVMVKTEANVVNNMAFLTHWLNNSDWVQSSSLLDCVQSLQSLKGKTMHYLSLYLFALAECLIYIKMYIKYSIRVGHCDCKESISIVLLTYIYVYTHLHVCT